MWQNLFFWIANTFSEVKGTDERRNARADVNDRATGKIQGRESSAASRVQQPSLPPHHVRQRSIDANEPEYTEYKHGFEFHALGESACNQSGSNNRKHQLIHHEGLLRNGCCVCRICRTT